MQYGGRTRRSAVWAACVLLSQRSQRDARPAALQATLLNTLPRVCTQATLSHTGVNDVGVCLYPPSCFTAAAGLCAAALRRNLHLILQPKFNCSTQIWRVDTLSHDISVQKSVFKYRTF